MCFWMTVPTFEPLGGTWQRGQENKEGFPIRAWVWQSLMPLCLFSGWLPWTCLSGKGHLLPHPKKVLSFKRTNEPNFHHCQVQVWQLEIPGVAEKDSLELHA